MAMQALAHAAVAAVEQVAVCMAAWQLTEFRIAGFAEEPGYESLRGGSKGRCCAHRLLPRMVPSGGRRSEAWPISRCMIGSLDIRTPHPTAPPARWHPSANTMCSSGEVPATRRLVASQALQPTQQAAPLPPAGCTLAVTERLSAEQVGCRAWSVTRCSG